jgi:hypothetical protein
MIICDYGKATRPKVPFSYFAEVMSGFEYSAAAHMIYAGMVKEGIECIENIRRRYDGERRNPWDEAECGHHYARAMAAWSGILALSGFRYDGSQKSIVALPKVSPGKFSSFWSTGTGWGTFSHAAQSGRTRFSLSVLYGKLPFRTLELASTAGGAHSAKLGARDVPYEVRRNENRMTLVFSQLMELTEGDQLNVTI